MLSLESRSKRDSTRTRPSAACGEWPIGIRSTRNAAVSKIRGVARREDANFIRRGACGGARRCSSGCHARIRGRKIKVDPYYKVQRASSQICRVRVLGAASGGGSKLGNVVGKFKFFATTCHHGTLNPNLTSVLRVLCLCRVTRWKYLVF